MITSSHYSKRFHSDGLTKLKYDKLKAHAMDLLVIRNELSELINSDLMRYLSISKYDFQTEMLAFLKGRVHSNFSKQVCDDVFVAYENRFSALQAKIKFLRIKRVEVVKYQKKTKTNKKGDIKSIVKHTESTKLTQVLTYLARYGNEYTREYVSKSLEVEANESKKKFYIQLLETFDKLGFDRLLNLALSKRKQVLSKYKKPVEFESLTFRGRSRLKENIVTHNENFNSVIDSFINFGWTETRSRMTIPVKYSKKFHGNMSKYTNKTDTSYIVKFNRNKSIQVILTYEDDRCFPEANECSSFVGFDVNVKHNQLIGSNGLTTFHNKKLLDDLIIELKKIDELKKNKKYVIGNKRQVKIDTLRRKIKHHTQSNCSYICKQMVDKNENHAVFENLDNSFGKTYAKTENDFNYNRLIKEMKISSIKDEFEHIARKYDIAVSTVHSEYTSQQCSHCGCIDDGNRLTQEEFVCQECGYTNNADSNASLNIKMRVSEAVQRDMLLKASKLGNGSYSPKTFHRHKVKEMLLSLRYRAVKLRELSLSDENQFLMDSL